MRINYKFSFSINNLIHYFDVNSNHAFIQFLTTLYSILTFKQLSTIQQFHNYL